MVQDAENCKAEDETNMPKIEAKSGLVKYCLSQRNTFSEEKLKDERATAGNTHVGGDDLDNCIVDFCMQDFTRKHRDPDPAGQLRASRRLRTQRVRAMLSRAQTDYFRNFMGSMEGACAIAASASATCMSGRRSHILSASAAHDPGALQWQSVMHVHQP